MEWLDKMNSALEYIEENLDDIIDTDEVARKACCSSYNFQRMFSFIADVSLAEYIRRRRLTQAAFELKKEGSSVLDIAIKYGYDSPVSFARAFQNLHGVTPNEARKESTLLRSYPKLSFKLTIKGVEDLKYRIIRKDSFRLVGVSQSISTKDGQNYQQIPEMWKSLCEDGTCVAIEDFTKVTDDEWYGVCYNFRNEGFDYLIGVKSDAVLPEGYTELIIPELTWVMFENRGKMPESMQDIWKRMFTEWFPTSGYEHDDGPEIEWYSNERVGPNEYLNEVWIPVKKL